MSDALAVWYCGTRVAVIAQERGRLRLVYTEDVLRRYPLGIPLLSLSLPLTSQRYTHGVVRPFIV
ncbi:MAG: HipA N-terminal domain-containing protein [Candidatus Dormibacteraceae bacterium]